MSAIPTIPVHSIVVVTPAQTLSFLEVHVKDTKSINVLEDMKSVHLPPEDIGGSKKVNVSDYLPRCPIPQSEYASSHLCLNFFSFLGENSKVLAEYFSGDFRPMVNSIPFQLRKKDVHLIFSVSPDTRLVLLRLIPALKGSDLPFYRTVCVESPSKP